ncbi:MAG: hypothetical protein M3Z31_03255 [Pseudomonadota bacterium]|nr:hypothetical protein [Pseudomonadota bacterium]
MRFPLPLRHVLCLSLSAALYAPMVAAGPTAAPFHATISFAEQVFAGPSTTSPCMFQSAVVGEGVASATGAVTASSHDCINPASATATLFVATDLVLKSASGDEIHGQYAGILSAGYITGGYTISGGTGRFKHASGYGTLQGTETFDFDTLSGTGLLQLKGSISY